MKWVKFVMMEQEVEHLETFDTLINERNDLFFIQSGGCRVCPWFGDSGNGAKGSHGMHNRCEEVIGEHYQKQAENLGSDEASLKKTIERFRDEELEHGILRSITRARGAALRCMM